MSNLYAKNFSDADEATGIAAAQKIAEIRGQAATKLPVRMIGDVKGSTFVSH